MKYIEKTLEELKQQKGKWAIWIDDEELYNKARKQLNLCDTYYGPAGYSNYSTHANTYNTIETAYKYWAIEQKMPFFILQKTLAYEIY